MNIHERLREVRATPLMAVCLCSLLSAVAFGVPWALDDGSDNQPFPRGLRRFVVTAAAVHFGSIGYRALKAVWRWEPVGPIVWRVLSAYVLLGVTGAVGWVLHDYNVALLAHLVLALPAGWGFYLLAAAMMPARPDQPASPPSSQGR